MGHDQGMQRWPVWPARYRVTARSGLGPTRNLRDVTWLFPEKARDVTWLFPEKARDVTWLFPEKARDVAVRAGGRDCGTSDGIDDSVVYGLGPAEGDRRGVVVIGAGPHDPFGILTVDIGGRPAMSAAALQGVIR
jgi:hypothetical protein